MMLLLLLLMMMMMMMMIRNCCLYLTVVPVFSAALSDVLDAFKLPENAARLNEARDAAGNDMLKGMQIVFPVLAQIQMDVIHKYGFVAEGDGKMRSSVDCKWFC
jgi:hypothetical protein